MQLWKPLDSDLIELVNLYFKTLSKITIKNYREIIQQLIKIWYEILEQANISLEGCPKAQEEVMLVIDKVLTFVTKEGYLEKVIVHSVVERAKVISMWNDIIKMFKIKKVYQAGERSGELFIFLFFTDWV